MFDFDCPSCKKRLLIFPSQITRMVNDEQGIAVLLTCWCGAPGAIRTGAASSAATDWRARHALAS